MGLAHCEMSKSIPVLVFWNAIALEKKTIFNSVDSNTHSL